MHRARRVDDEEQLARRDVVLLDAVLRLEVEREISGALLVRAMREGFQFVDKSDVLANPKDDRTKTPFTPDIRRHTDQFLYRFRKAS